MTEQNTPAQDHAQVGEPTDPLWPNDTGTLRDQSRRALLELLKGPYLSGQRRPQLWAALMADQPAITSALHNLFLDLVIDPVDEFAFVRKAQTADFDAPSALRREPLTLLDTAVVLVLRQLLLATGGTERVIVGKEEIYERVAVYRTGDEVAFQRNFNGSWSRMVDRFRFLARAGEDRVEISPVVKFIVDEDRVRALLKVYQELANPTPPVDTGSQSAPVPQTPALPQAEGMFDLFSPTESNEAPQ
ncbi:DUF4194 domain-containing protein [Jonesiaceae bacterium BS-20]|uniref:DUF4194 domain-containing protein n=1 Tax=Jonesiaceae bacterium BS-20 TaxID=3120821 RepID=A0AAU7DSL2_9MICO